VHRARHVARRDLQRCGHHRAGLRLSRHRHAAGERGACGRLQPRPRRHLDLDRRRLDGGPGDRPALPAARSSRESRLGAMLRVLRDLLRRNREFAIGASLIAIVVAVAAISVLSPYPPEDSYVVPPDVPPSWPYILGTTSRGQDVFWQL